MKVVISIMRLVTRIVRIAQQNISLFGDLLFLLLLPLDLYRRYKFWEFISSI